MQFCEAIIHHFIPFIITLITVSSFHCDIIIIIYIGKTNIILLYYLLKLAYLLNIVAHKLNKTLPQKILVNLTDKCLKFY